MIVIWNYGAHAQLNEGMGVWNWSGPAGVTAPWGYGDVLRLADVTVTGPSLSSMTGTGPSFSGVTMTGPVLDDVEMD